MTDKHAAAFETMVHAATGDATRLAALARAAPGAGLRNRAYPLASAARALDPEDAEIVATTEGPYSGAVPSWHFLIVADLRRNAAYAAAIARAVQPGDRVLDIGAGTGLLGMMAARAGAASVVACEMNPAVAEAASEIIAANGLADRVKIVPKFSIDLDPELDVGGPVDVLVSEIVANDILGEDALPVMVDAARRLLKPGGRMIPEGATALAALVEFPRWDAETMTEAGGFDLSIFNRLRHVPEKVQSEETDVRLRSAAVPVYTFDFTRGGDWPPVRTQVDATAQGGRVNGVLLWMRLQLDAETSYEVEVASGEPSSWAALFFPLATPTDYPAGTSVTIHGAHDEHSIRVWVDQRA